MVVPNPRPEHSICPPLILGLGIPGTGVTVTPVSKKLKNTTEPKLWQKPLITLGTEKLLEAFEGGPAATRPGVGSSEEQPPPSRRPAPSPGPSFPATAPARPCHVKRGRRGVGAERGPRTGWAGLGSLASPGHGAELTPDGQTLLPGWIVGPPPLRLPSV